MKLLITDYEEACMAIPPGSPALIMYGVMALTVFVDLSLRSVSASSLRTS